MHFQARWPVALLANGVAARSQAARTAEPRTAASEYERRYFRGRARVCPGGHGCPKGKTQRTGAHAGKHQTGDTAEGAEAAIQEARSQLGGPELSRKRTTRPWALPQNLRLGRRHAAASGQ
ncbi:hypothetical protein, conserved in T. vivax [Trypanosoma vivax Y486]|uniref:Uncharacterized protein n=1 Tax=Trypanosoma vivax (strain Y486) TaxID=1055687 RepID=F9WQF8_TRYVY|nr:hypothetical protein, conserved in T. vivax [Trypanosoma vivax Y486]|eukprot:CCD19786.1 hypothetical protein, conserved in T. vivax [Trypanosoma vivax Y486]